MTSGDETGSKLGKPRFSRGFLFALAVVMVLGAMTALSAWSMTRSPLPRELAPDASPARDSVDGDYSGVSFLVDGYTEIEMRRFLKEKLPRKSIGGERYMSGVISRSDIELYCKDEQLECGITFWRKMGFFEAELRHKGWLR